MIPGNHDQVTLGGGMHALTPLQFAFADPKQVGRARLLLCKGHAMKSFVVCGRQRLLCWERSALLY